MSIDINPILDSFNKKQTDDIVFRSEAEKMIGMFVKNLKSYKNICGTDIELWQTLLQKYEGTNS